MLCKLLVLLTALFSAKVSIALIYGKFSMKMICPWILISSLILENHRFSVIAKTKKCLDDIDKFIKENHFDECGIIYCLSRMDCEKVAERLQVGLSYGHFFLLKEFYVVSLVSGFPKLIMIAYYLLVKVPLSFLHLCHLC